MTRIPTVTELEADQGDRPSLPTAPFQTLTVEAHHAGARLDKFLVDRVPELSRARVKAMIEGGQVRLDGRRARKGDAVAVGQTVDLLAPPPPRDFDPIADASITLSVLYEDADVIVVDKPSGMPTHPLQPSELGTAANAIIAKYPRDRRRRLRPQRAWALAPFGHGHLGRPRRRAQSKGLRFAAQRLAQRQGAQALRRPRRGLGAR
jgi:hypothetical protein